MTRAVLHGDTVALAVPLLFVQAVDRIISHSLTPELRHVGLIAEWGVCV